MSLAFDDPIGSWTSALFCPLGVDGVYARTALLEHVVDGLGRLIAANREAGSEVLRFPPVMSRAQLEKTGYQNNFPQLLGGVCCLDRHVADGQPWSAAAATSDLVVTPAACYPVYPLVAARGEVPAAGLLFDVAADCFRREPSRQLDRLQSFRMREFVCIGSAEQASAFRACWLARAEELAGRLGLNWRIDKASDPFFGRTGKLLAMSQVEQSLKYGEVRAARAGVFAGAPDRLHELQLPSRPLRRDLAAAHHRRRARPHLLRRLRHRPPGAGAVRHPRRRLRKLAPGRARSLAAVTDARRADGRAVRKDR